MDAMCHREKYISKVQAEVGVQKLLALIVAVGLSDGVLILVINHVGVRAPAGKLVFGDKIM